MESKENQLDNFLSNIPNGFKVPNEKFNSEWKYFFHSIKKNLNRRYMAKCIFCGMECEGRPERLPFHFSEKKCTIIPEYLLNEYLIDYRANCESKDSNQNKNNQIIGKESEFNNDVLNEIALKFVISANVSFRVIDNPFFKRLINYASANKRECRLYSSTTMRYKIFNKFVTKIRSNNLESLKSKTEITIAMDGWTDVTGKSIYAIIAISSSEEHILSIDDLSSLQHTAYNLKEYLISVVFTDNHIDPTSILAIVTDSPNVMEKMKTEVQNDYNNIIPIKCALHILNLISKDIAHQDSSREIIKDNSKIINFFKSSHLMLSWIKNYQKEKDIKNTIQSFTESRWYSLSKLCLSVHTYKAAFQKAAETCDIGNREVLSIIQDDIHFIKNKCLLDLIKPIADSIAYLEKNSSTLADVCFSILDIYVKIEAVSVPRCCTSLKTNALKLIFKRFLSLHQNKIYIVAFFLWPKFKRVVLSDKNKIVDIIIEVLRLAMYWELFDKSEANQLKEELILYADDRRQFSQSQDELMMPQREYWKKYLFSNQPIYKFANKIFSICPHSASVERLFSRLGITKSKLRNRMSIQTLSKIAVAQYELNNEIKKEKELSGYKDVENECMQNSQSDDEQKDGQEDEQEDEISIFYDENEEIETEFNQNERKNLNAESSCSTAVQDFEQLIQPFDEQESNNGVDSIYQYFNIFAFKEIISTNNLKTRNSTNLDSFGPPTKKIRNNFTIEDIVSDIV